MGQAESHGTEAEISSGTQAGGGGDARLPGVGISQSRRNSGLGATMFGRWRRKLRRIRRRHFGKMADRGMRTCSLLRRELARVTKEWDFLREAAACFAEIFFGVLKRGRVNRQHPHESRGSIRYLYRAPSLSTTA